MKEIKRNNKYEFDVEWDNTIWHFRANVAYDYEDDENFLDIWGFNDYDTRKIIMRYSDAQATLEETKSFVENSFKEIKKEEENETSREN